MRQVFQIVTVLVLGTSVMAAHAAQSIAVPAYFYPSYPDPVWAQMQSAVPPVAVAVMNPASGPGAAPDANYVSQIAAARAAGVAVLGYVTTSYATRPASAVEAEVDAYYAWYGVDGIFFDEAANTCPLQSYYAGLDTYVKAKGGLGRTVINPGINTPECFVTAADILLNFEGSFSAYQTWTPDGWEAGYDPSHFWHLVYGASAGQMPTAVLLSQSRGAGYVYVTDDGLPNPWDTLPPYWAAELAQVNPASACPSTAVRARLAVVGVDSPEPDDSLVLSGEVVLPPGPAIAPPTTGVRLVLADQAGVVVDVTLPAGVYLDPPGYGWKTNGSGTTWKWVDSTSEPATGVGALTIRDLSGSTPGRIKFRLRGRDAAFPVRTNQLPLTALLYFDPAVTGTPCALASFPGPTSMCMLNSSGSKVSCR
jgi:Spherulation-specific family 4